ncbi:hypothetical protein [Fibrobacter sp.]|uniref:hypothetical protein n=1 Tax=Fibrobacter sp. TaxID=35828 RepID=UPI003869CA09
MKLQDAYASEANKVGSWELIGYVAPGAMLADNVPIEEIVKYSHLPKEKVLELQKNSRL